MRMLEDEISNITATVRVRRKELADKKSQVKGKINNDHHRISLIKPFISRIKTFSS